MAEKDSAPLRDNDQLKQIDQELGESRTDSGLEFDKTNARGRSVSLQQNYLAQVMNLEIQNQVVSEESSDMEERANESIRLGIFTLIWMTAMFQNLDTGVIPTCINPIMEEL